jgi:uncharacterized membrane protein
MTPRWERTASPPSFEGETLFMDAELRPHRSLSAKAFKYMLIAVIAVKAIVAAVFVAQGAFPVAGFLGLDVLALWFAFRMNYRAGRALERVQVAAGRVYCERCEPDGRSVHWLLNPLWARVFQDGRGVLIRSGAEQLRIATFLSPDERVEFAEALSKALWRGKRGY